MTAAINGNPKENDKARTYGAIFINYHPYYYRGVAYLNTGKYEQAISDFEKASGPGEENLGSIETLMSRAKGKLAQASAPAARTAASRAAAARRAGSRSRSGAAGRAVDRSRAAPARERRNQSGQDAPRRRACSAKPATRRSTRKPRRR